MGYAGFAGIASFDAADAEEFLAAAFEVGFDGFNVGGGTTRIMPMPMLKDCSNSLVSIFPSTARNLKMGGTGQEARSICAFTPGGERAASCREYRRR